MKPQWNPFEEIEIALEKPLSMIGLSWKEEYNNQRTSKMANTLVSLDSFKPMFLEKLSSTFPSSSLSTPPIPAGLGLPLVASSVLNLKTAGGGGRQTSNFLIL